MLGPRLSTCARRAATLRPPQGTGRGDMHGRSRSRGQREHPRGGPQDTDSRGRRAPPRTAICSSCIVSIAVVKSFIEKPCDEPQTYLRGRCVGLAHRVAFSLCFPWEPSDILTVVCTRCGAFLWEIGPFQAEMAQFLHI